MNNLDIQQVLINKNESIRKAVGQLNQDLFQILFVVDENKKLSGTITDGDIRRGIINNVSLNDSIEKIMHKNFRFINEKDKNNKNKIKEIMVKDQIRCLPVLNDDDGQIVDLIFKEEWQNEEEIVYDNKTTPVVIMAGGLGRRLNFLTSLIPKALAPVKDKPITEIIMNNFSKYGFNNFILSLNYKADMIMNYFSEVNNNLNYNIQYILEDKMLGTAGSLRLMKEYLNEPFFVSNCDVLIEENFDKILQYYYNNKFDALIVATNKKLIVQYGVIETEREKYLKNIVEKPELLYNINSGIYLFNNNVVDLIDNNEFIHATNLLLRAKENGMNIGVYFSDQEWFDIGQIEEYEKTSKYFEERE
jgi:dTDP-glucose pyrophosphorylase